MKTKDPKSLVIALNLIGVSKMYAPKDESKEEKTK